MMETEKKEVYGAHLRMCNAWWSVLIFIEPRKYECYLF